VGEFLLVVGRVRARDRNGLRVDSEAQWLWKLRDGRVSYWAVYTDLEEALEAVAASEQSADR
jgi:ketosteroid isomerase-like protein